jgi:hypothetical protein
MFALRPGVPRAPYRSIMSLLINILFGRKDLQRTDTPAYLPGVSVISQTSLIFEGKTRAYPCEK